MVVNWVGPYTDPGIEFKVEVSVGTQETIGDSIWDTSLWNTGVWAQSEYYWQEVTARLTTWEVNRGRNKFTDSVPPGTFSFELIDDDGLFNPDYSGVTIGVLQLRPGRFARISARAKDSQTWTPLVTGKIDRISEQYTNAAFQIVARFQCTDFLAILSRENPPALETPVGAGELPGPRIQRVLTAAGFDLSILDGPITDYIQDGTRTLQATTLPQSRSVEIYQASASEGGVFWFDARGAPRFLDATWDDNPTPTLTVGDGTDHVLVGGASMTWDVARVVNDVRFTRANGTEQRVVSTASAAAYGDRTYQRSDLLNDNDADVFDLAGEWLARYQWDRGRLEEITVAPRSTKAADNLFTLDIADVVRVNVLTGHDWGYTFDAYVNRVRHIGGTGGDYRCVITLDNVDRSDPSGGGAFSNAYSNAYDVIT